MDVEHCEIVYVDVEHCEVVSVDCECGCFGFFMPLQLGKNKHKTIIISVSKHFLCIYSKNNTRGVERLSRLQAKKCGNGSFCILQF